jgi:hypothetical protein
MKQDLNRAGGPRPLRRTAARSFSLATKQQRFGLSADKAPRLRRLKRAATQKSTGLPPQRTHCYGCRPVDMATR